LPTLPLCTRCSSSPLLHHHYYTPTTILLILLLHYYTTTAQVPSLSLHNLLELDATPKPEAEGARDSQRAYETYEGEPAPHLMNTAPNYFTTILLHGYSSTLLYPSGRPSASWLKAAQNSDGDTTPEPTRACLEAWGAPAQSGGQPRLIGCFAGEQQCCPSPPSKWRVRNLNQLAAGCVCGKVDCVYAAGLLCSCGRV
jgi:hypothetical protein